MTSEQEQQRRARAIWAAVERIPPGRVASYGEVAGMAGLPGRARLVGKLLGQLPPNSGVPWHRVVNSQGKISLQGQSALRQRRLLEAEGVQFSDAGRISLRRYGC